MYKIIYSLPDSYSSIGNKDE